MEPQSVEQSNNQTPATTTQTVVDQPLPEIIGTQKSFPWLVVIFAVLFVTTLIAGTFFFLRMQSLQKQLTMSPSPSATTAQTVVNQAPTPSNDPAAAWQTYTNDQYKFSIKYPPQWVSEKYSPTDTRIPYLINKSNSYQIQIIHDKDNPLLTRELTGLKEDAINGIPIFVNLDFHGDDGKYMMYYFQINMGEYIRLLLPLSNGPANITWGQGEINLAKSIASTFRFTDTTSSTDPNTITFASNKLGITFQYQKQSKGTKEQFSTKEIGNKVYIYPSTQGYESGQYVEIFSKSENDSLNTAISNSILSKYSSEDCIVKPNGINIKNLPSSYQTATITLPPSAYEIEPEQSDAMAAKCPQKYLNFRGISYFVSDNLHPTKFAFFSIGQYAISGSSDKNTWQDTFRFTDQ